MSWDDVTFQDFWFCFFFFYCNEGHKSHHPWHYLANYKGLIFPFQDFRAHSDNLLTFLPFMPSLDFHKEHPHYSPPLLQPANPQLPCWCSEWTLPPWSSYQGGLAKPQTKTDSCDEGCAVMWDTVVVNYPDCGQRHLLCFS